MKRLLKQKLSKTSKASIRRIYLNDKQIEEAGFKIGEQFSYEVDFKTHQVRIVPNTSLAEQGKVSRKKRGSSMIPLLDVNNKLIEKTFDGFNQCRITFFEDEVLIEAVDETIETPSTESSSSALTFTQLCKNVASNVLSFAEKKKRRKFALQNNSPITNNKNYYYGLRNHRFLRCLRHLSP